MGFMPIAVVAGAVFAVAVVASLPPEKHQPLLCRLPVGLLSLPQLQECLGKQMREVLGPELAKLEAELTKQRNAMSSAAQTRR